MSILVSEDYVCASGTYQRTREGDIALHLLDHSSEVLQTRCSETKRFLVEVNLFLNGESSRMAPLRLSFLSYGIGLGIVKGTRGVAGWMGGGGECAGRET